MRLGIVSDLHLEFSDCAVPCRDIDVLVLAGDTHTSATAIRAFVDALLNRHPRLHVVLVPGNHEYYGKTLCETEIQLESLNRDRCHVLLNSVAVIGGVMFVGGTLWAHIPPGMRSHHMNDYDRIHGLTPAVMENECADCVDAIQEASWGTTESLHSTTTTGSSNNKSSQNTGSSLKLVVVTHFAPSRRSIAPKYGNPAAGANCYYASDLDGAVAGSGAALWIHGHTHTSMDYTIGDTRVVCNPRGYSKSANDHPENPAFVCPLVVELDCKVPCEMFP